MEYLLLYNTHRIQTAVRQDLVSGLIVALPEETTVANVGVVGNY